ncbi:VOC family protein [Aquabacterium sp. A7-Y]|uniref:VOC family protein n=1 Tax=Aquabacterium sp. A7-Y TaxID=1349605 RepID=UPI00223C97BB|nr:VOC family protein [Aquabacterium sp. A7-Y]MCW7538074.1 VOC family protein [Aquabacterium sp. A7-Y]
MAQLDPYLMFDGSCADAMRFYERTLGGTLDAMVTFGSAPPCGDGQLPAGLEHRIMHAHMLLQGRSLMASDSMPGRPYEGMKGFALALSYPEVDEARRIFDALAEGGQVTMPMQKTFWAEAFGMLTDRFGTPWMVNGGLTPT